MLKRKQATPKPTYFSREDSVNLDGFIISRGDIIKIQGEYGSIFKFIGFTTNNLTGASWVDCFEVIGGVPSVFRSFKTEKVKRVPQRGKRAKRVND